jgi:hypothetical protein
MFTYKDVDYSNSEKSGKIISAFVGAILLVGVLFDLFFK